MKTIASWNALIMVVAFALILTTISIGNRQADLEKLPTTSKMMLTIIVGLHFLFSLVGSYWAFIFTSRLDVWYLGIGLLILVHHIVLRECILNYFEKRILDPSYRMGSDSFSDPHIDALGLRPLHIYIFLQNIIVILMILFVSYRTSHLVFACLALLLIVSLMNNVNVGIVGFLKAHYKRAFE